MITAHTSETERVRFNDGPDSIATTATWGKVQGCIRGFTTTSTLQYTHANRGSAVVRVLARPVGPGARAFAPLLVVSVALCGEIGVSGARSRSS